MSVKNLLRSSYGPNIGCSTSRYERIGRKIARFKNHVAFSVRCKREGIIPISLKVRSPIDTAQGRRIAHRASQMFLSERIRVSNFKLRQLEDERKWMEIGLRRSLSSEDFDCMEKRTRENVEFEFVSTRERQRKKFDRLKESSQTIKDNGRPKNSNMTPTRWIYNFSSHQLDSNEKSVLQRGFNFAKVPKAIPKTEFIAGVEAAIQQHKRLEPEKAERTRAAIAIALDKAKIPPPNTTTEERKALKRLNQNKNVTVLCADKGNATVLLDTAEYEKKAEDLLKNPPFRKLKKDPTIRNEKRVNDTLKELTKKEPNNANIFKSLHVPCNGTKPPLFYGSVKIHKEGHPLRPIVSTIDSATYNVAKFVSRTLSPYAEQIPSYIKNTSDFVDKLKNISIEQDETMVSFDVKSLFTSVPVKRAAVAIEKILNDDETLRGRTTLSVNAIMSLVKLCLSMTSFQFRGAHYDLVDGLPMGSPASPCIANLFMAQFENEALASFHTKPKIWLRFVDDVFAIVKKHALEELLAHLNAKDSKIQFTVEREAEDRLPFMDVTVHRQQNQLKTSVYRKPTHTGRYLSFDSHHPDSMKRSVVRALRTRVNYITIDEKSKRAEEQYIEDDLVQNGYPKSFIRKTRMPPTSRGENSGDNEPPEVEAIATIPYIKGVSENISRLLAQINIRTVTRPAKWKWSLMRGVKDEVPKDQVPGVVYALGCTDCHSIYIGETNRTAKQRTKEHNMHARNGHPELSAVADHAHNGHDIHWTPRILEREGNTMKRKVKEALAIKTLQKKRGQDVMMNQDSGMKLSRIWLDLV